MKCLCPLEDRQCPGDCSPKERAKRRAARAEQLYRQGNTMEQIATQLGVTNQTISNDLRKFPNDLEIKKPAKTATNPKGAGRPKGNGKRGRPHKPRNGQDQAAALLMLDEGKSRVEAAQATGLRQNVVQLSMERELGRRETLNQLLDAAAVEHFADKGKLKIEDAIRIHKARLDRQFEQRVNEEVIRRIAEADDAAREQNKQMRTQILGLERVIRQSALFTIEQFNTLRRCLHPDRIQRLNDPEMIEDFERAAQLLSEKKRPLTGVH